MEIDPRLPPFVRFAVSILSRVNEDPRLKTLQGLYHRQIGQRWIHACTKNLLHVEGLEHVRDLAPEGGALLCANHRSFFDQYVVSALLLRHTPWVRELTFPVRSSYFYETWSGLALNLAMGGGAMYPPIFRDPALGDLNVKALELAETFLRRPGAIVGVHPEGTRGKGPDPYALLPAQPGVGRVALRSRAPVIPAFINGLGNDVAAQIGANFGVARRGAPTPPPIIVVLGPPVDLSDLMTSKPRLALNKRAADRILDAVRALGERERALRAAL